MEYITLRIDNSGCSVIHAIGCIPETIGGIIKCNISNEGAYLSVPFDVDDILIVLDLR